MSLQAFLVKNEQILKQIRLPRERELEFRINNRSIYGHGQWIYRDTDHAILVPNFRWWQSCNGKAIQESNLDFNLIVQSANHEILHKILHEFVGFYPMWLWDNIDKNPENTAYILSAL